MVESIFSYKMNNLDMIVPTMEIEENIFPEKVLETLLQRNVVLVVVEGKERDQGKGFWRVGDGTVLTEIDGRIYFQDWQGPYVDFPPLSLSPHSEPEPWPDS